MQPEIFDFPIPLAARPAIDIATRFLLADRNHCIIYKARSHAVHLYEYECVMRFGDTPVQILPGDMTISPAGTETSYHLPEPGEHLCSHFHIPRVPGRQATIPMHMRLGPHQSFAAERMNHIIRLHQEGQTDIGTKWICQAAASAALQELLLYLARLAAGGDSQPQSRSSQAVDRLAEIIRKRLAMTLSVPELASEVGVTQNYLARMFRRRFGVSIPQYIMLCRIGKAIHLLTITNMLIKAVGQAVGIPDPQYFNKQFRKATGVSPSQYRHQATA